MSWGVQKLTVRYGGREALAGVDLEVTPGRVTAVVGGDGSGKSTLLRTLAGVVQAQSGTVRRPTREQIGYVSGAAGLYADLTVDENVEFSAAAYGLKGEALERRREALLSQTGLAPAHARLAAQLSGGMRQKLAFALAMLHEPKLLILDEPTTGVDPVSRAELWRLIAGAAADGAAVVVATTYMDEAERAAQVLVLDKGRALAAGPPEAVAAALPRPVSRRARAAGGVPAGTLAEPVAGGAASGGILDDPHAVTTDSFANEPSVSARERSGEALSRTGQARPSLGGPLAEARRATRRFGDVVAVEPTDLVVRSGEIVGLLGANGAGKTTLIRLLLGLLRPTSGDTLLFGTPPSRETRQRIGYMPQGLGLWDDLSVEENLAFASAAFGVPAPPLDAELEAARHQLVRDLSLGLKRRLAFVAALAHHPQLLVLDEPTSGVDPQARARLWDTVHEAAGGGAGLHEAAGAGAGVLVTTHYLEEAGQCDRLVIMARGRVVAEGTEASIVGDRQAVAVELDGADWAVAFAALDDAGLPVALHGRRLRVPVAGEAGDTEARVRAALDARHITAELKLVPASLEEAFVELARVKTNLDEEAAMRSTPLERGPERRT